MDNSQSQEIKNRADIVEVVRESIPNLKQSGSNWKGVCPFHNEKTPSFMVSQDKQIWHCFGCNEGGDVFTFLMKIQGIEFYDALKELADRTGVVLAKSDPAAASLRTTLIDIHTHARELFSKELLGSNGSQAREYIKKRGIAKELVLELGIGLSPESWDMLYTTLVKNGFTNKQILASGLILQSDKGKYFDRFRERLMFSLIDSGGQIIGMAGRTLKKDEKEAKYINSPQTVLYNKSNFLYGFYQAKQSIRKEDLVVIVEGYFDWIALYRNGYTNVVAVSGTALTESHMMVLKRYTKNIAFAFDTDEAGRRALERSVSLTLAHECTPFILDYQSYNGGTYKDPDELMLAHKDAWNDVIAKKELALAYYIRTVQEELTSNDILIQKKALATIMPILQMTKSAIDKDHFLKKIAALSGISIDALKEEIGKIKAIKDPQYVATPRESPPIKSEDRSPRRERLLQWISFIINKHSLFHIIAKEISAEEIQDEGIKEVFIELRKVYEKKGSLPEYKGLARLITIPTEFESWILKAEELFNGFSEEDLEKEIVLLTKKIKEDNLRFTLLSISKKIAKAESTDDEKELKELIGLHREVTDSLSQLLN